MRGKIIVLEGLDKSGKSTQSKMLHAKLLERGMKVELMEFPDYSNQTGMIIRSLLHDRESYPHQYFHMMMSANRWENLHHIDWFLNDGKTIIMDRYYQSNLIYGMANNVDVEWLKKLDEGLPKADLVIVININTDLSFERGVERDNIEADKKLMDKALQLYKEVGMTHGWKSVEGDRDRDQVHKDIMRFVEPILVKKDSV